MKYNRALEREEMNGTANLEIVNINGIVLTCSTDVTTLQGGLLNLCQINDC